MEFDEFVYGEIFENNIVNSYSGKQAKKIIVNLVMNKMKIKLIIRIELSSRSSKVDLFS